MGAAVGICYNILNQFLPARTTSSVRQAFESHLHKKISSNSICNTTLKDNSKVNIVLNPSQVYPFQAGEDYTFRIKIDQCETALIVASFIAQTSNSAYAKNWNTVQDTNNKEEERYIKMIFDSSSLINAKCREILMVGFFHVYGMQTHELETKMVEQVGLIEKAMISFSTTSNDQKKLENFMNINACRDYLTLLDQEVLKNLMIRIRTYIEDKQVGMGFWQKMHSEFQPRYFNSNLMPY